MKELEKKTTKKTIDKTKAITEEIKAQTTQEKSRKKYTTYFQNKIRRYLKETNLIEEIKNRFEFYIKNVGPRKDIFYGFIKPGYLYPSHIHDKDNQEKDSLISHGFLGDTLYLIAIPRKKDVIIEEHDWDDKNREFTYKTVDSRLYVEISVQVDFVKQMNFYKKLMEENPDAKMTIQEILDCKEIHRIDLRATQGVGFGLDLPWNPVLEKYEEIPKGNKTDIEYLLYILDEHISDRVSDARAERYKN
tara:strand:- start:98 stop:838 length:741 start_codon:yes stop_codon:yes gene_type:complete